MLGIEFSSLSSMPQMVNSIGVLERNADAGKWCDPGQVTALPLASAAQSVK